MPPDFEREILPHLDAAHNLARWLVTEPALAEDVVQDAALRAYTAFAGFRGDNPRAWLLRIVRNTAYDTLAARRRLPAAPLDDPAHLLVDPGEDPEAALLRCQDLVRLDQALAALPIDLREALVLRELEELSYKDIAAITAVPIGTVMSRLWRARQALLRWHKDHP